MQDQGKQAQTPAEYGEPESVLALRRRVDRYAAWISDLRSGQFVAPMLVDVDDPLAVIGRELQLLSETITRREAELRKLFDVVHTMDQGIVIEDVLDKIFGAFAAIIPYDRIGCAFLSDDGTRLTAYWAKSNFEAVQIGKGYTQALAGSSLNDVLRTGQPRILNDLESYLAAKPESDSTRRIVAEGGRSSLTCPLIVDQRPIGCLFFTSGKANTYRHMHQLTFLQIATNVATAIEKSRELKRLIDKNRVLVLQAEQLRIAANRDPLTGILNRGAIMAALDSRLRASSAARSVLGVVMVDIDHFKRVNDNHGHAAGDSVLCGFTRRVAAMLRRSDYFGRYGGEEFLILIGDTSQDGLQEIVERFRLAIESAPFDLGEKALAITASFGMTLMDGDAADADLAVAAADRALFAAKHAGRNCGVVG